jgi:ankyrin repeat protein
MSCVLTSRCSCRLSNTACAQLLLQRGANPSVKNTYEQNVMLRTLPVRALHCSLTFTQAIHLCCVAGATGIIELLLPLLCPPGSSASTVIKHIGTGDKAGITPLHGALLTFCFLVSSNTRTAACRHGHHACIIALLLPHLSKAAAGPNCTGPMGLTPLHLAAAGGHADICTLLVGAFACSLARAPAMTAFRWS